MTASGLPELRPYVLADDHAPFSVVPMPIPMGPVGPVMPLGPVTPRGPVAPEGPFRTGVFPDITLKTRLISLVRPEKFADKTGVVLISIERRSIKFTYRNRVRFLYVKF